MKEEYNIVCEMENMCAHAYDGDDGQNIFCFIVIIVVREFPFSYQTFNEKKQSSAHDK